MSSRTAADSVTRARVFAELPAVARQLIRVGSKTLIVHGGQEALVCLERINALLFEIGESENPPDEEAVMWLAEIGVVRYVPEPLEEDIEAGNQHPSMSQ